MRKIAVVVTARPSFARIRTVLDHLAVDPLVDLRVIMAGSALLHHYGDVERDCPYPVAARLFSTLAENTSETSATETGVLTIKLSQTFAEMRPDLVVTIADRHETLATAIAASYQNLPLAHLQGGEHTGNIDDKVRHAVSSLADLHFPATADAATRLTQMQVNGHILMAGCPSIDLAARATWTGRYQNSLVILQHPVTTEEEEARAQIDATYAAIRSWRQYGVIWFWPGQDAGSDRIAKRLREIEHTTTNIIFKRHMPAQEFLSLLRSTRVLVGNSSAGVREGSYLGTPVVNIGTRQAGRQCAENVRHVGYDAGEIDDAIRYQVDHGPYILSALYGRGDAGPRIAAVLADADREDVDRGAGASRKPGCAEQELSAVGGV